MASRDEIRQNGISVLNSGRRCKNFLIRRKNKDKTIGTPTGDR